MERDEILCVIEKLIEADDTLSEEDIEALVQRFVDSIDHPGGSDLIYFPHFWGLGHDPSPEQILDEAINWIPRVLVMQIVEKTKHPRRTDLECYQVQVPDVCTTQIVSDDHFDVGDTCSVALSGCDLTNGRVVTHGFIDGAFSAGVIVARSDAPVGSVL
ncbi:MAG: bacteriocin immunity protein [Planctomycetota bacterium]